MPFKPNHSSINGQPKSWCRLSLVDVGLTVGYWFWNDMESQWQPCRESAPRRAESHGAKTLRRRLVEAQESRTAAMSILVLNLPDQILQSPQPAIGFENPNVRRRACVESSADTERESRCWR